MSIDHAAEPPVAPAFATLPPQRTPVEFDPESNGLRIGPYERRVEDPSDPDQVFGAYLSLLYAVRGAQPGEQLKLRSADLEALLAIVGDDPENIERRLIGLMGCTAQEAKVLGGALLRHRRLTATVGIAASLALGGAIAVDGDRAGDAPAQEITQSSSATTTGELPFAAPVPADAATSAATDFSTPSMTSVLLAGLDSAAPARSAEKAAPAPAGAPAGAASEKPAAAAAAPGGSASTDNGTNGPAPTVDPIDVVLQAPPAGAPAVDAAPPVDVPAQAPGFAPPGAVDTVVQPAPPAASNNGGETTGNGTGTELGGNTGGAPGGGTAIGGDASTGSGAAPGGDAAADADADADADLDVVITPPADQTSGTELVIPGTGSPLPDAASGAQGTDNAPGLGAVNENAGGNAANAGGDQGTGNGNAGTGGESNAGGGDNSAVTPPGLVVAPGNDGTGVPPTGVGADVVAGIGLPGTGSTTVPPVGLDDTTPVVITPGEGTDPSTGGNGTPRDNRDGLLRGNSGAPGGGSTPKPVKDSATKLKND